jgi:hypothetical protein
VQLAATAAGLRSPSGAPSRRSASTYGDSGGSALKCMCGSGGLLLAWAKPAATGRSRSPGTSHRGARSDGDAYVRVLDSRRKLGDFDYDC